MSLRNVTVTLPEELLTQARHLAVDEGLSLSKFLAMLVEERVRASVRYQAARERQLKTMRKGFDLGTGGRATWTRDELHER
ncbi:MAG: CopG family transcriptional regulator [Chloroflexi bacterium]|nr:CopG family transcriptional regulator [Chloroflexota bacterium]